MTLLHSRGFILRPVAAGDLPAIVEAIGESSDTVGRWMTWASSAYSETEASAWMQDCAKSLQEGTGYEFGIFTEGVERFVGAAGLNQFNKVNNFANLGYWVRASNQHQGAASAAVEALANYAFETLKLSRVEIVVAVGNEPSIAVARRSGAVFECIARNRLQLHGKPTDACVFSLVPALEA